MARRCKAAKRLQSQAIDARAAASSTSALIEVVRSEYHSVARSLSLTPLRPPMDERRAVVLLRLACMPLIRGDARGTQHQARAVAFVARAADVVQKRCFQALIAPEVEPPIDRQRIFVLAWQWDETSQRLRALDKPRLRGERRSFAQQAVQIMMQAGLMSSFSYQEDAFVLVAQTSVLV